MPELRRQSLATITGTRVGKNTAQSLQPNNGATKEAQIGAEKRAIEKRLAFTLATASDPGQAVHDDKELLRAFSARFYGVPVPGSSSCPSCRGPAVREHAANRGFGRIHLAHTSRCALVAAVYRTARTEQSA